MSLNIKAISVEEAEHPYYVIRYIVEDNGEELLNSVARYVAEANGRVQFLEPDMRKLLKLGLADRVDQPLQEIIDKIVRDKATAYIRENQEN